MARVLLTGGCGLLLLLLTLHSSTHIVSAKKTCFMSVRLATKTAVIEKDFKDYVIRGFLKGCGSAGRTCPGKVIPHFEGTLGGGVTPIRGKAAERLCEIFNREITPEENGEVFGKWHTGRSCGKSGSTYLGLLCCWKYTIGKYVFVVPNEGCVETTKPSA
ncbi:uncharacterized protein LOC121858031 [Homarus americanus]|uniref:uncharacterized protein LOC121858031 n=1 Tax=Homarus americanus TaxID=6706 RepID=UPI001C495D77|nr:uncharacterized protein LOC121858031 [Homarus americanus]